MTEYSREMEQLVRDRIALLHDTAPGSIGDLFGFSLRNYDPVEQEFTFFCRTQSWMCNSIGTLHGGICAAVLDQAFGFVANCVKLRQGAAPMVQLNTVCHHPVMAGEELIVKVRITSVSGSLISLNGSCFAAAMPERVCFSGTVIHFNKGK